MPPEDTPRTPPAKKFKSKWFRVATEGATSDGRQIERDWIEQMATSYDPNKYGARVWLEHLRGVVPDSPFRAYGDVIGVEARDVEDGKRALFAQIDPTDDLIALSRARQKVYTSIEINTKFADTGSAYLVGLAITDSPASLGTEVLSFARQNPSANPFASRKHDPENLFSEAVEVALEFDEEEPQSSLLDKIRAALRGTGFREQQPINQEFSRVAEELATHLAELQKASGANAVEMARLAEENKKLRADLEALTQRLDTEPRKHNHRPPAPGGSGQILTDI